VIEARAAPDDPYWKSAQLCGSVFFGIRGRSGGRDTLGWPCCVKPPPQGFLPGQMFVINRDTASRSAPRCFPAHRARPGRRPQFAISRIEQPQRKRAEPGTVPGAGHVGSNHDSGNAAAVNHAASIAENIAAACPPAPGRPCKQIGIDSLS